jgi:hypothetical protein
MSKATVTAGSVLSFVRVTYIDKERNQIKQDKLFDFILTLRRFSITFLAVEYLYVLNLMTVFLYSCLIHPVSTSHEPCFFVVCGLPEYTLFLLIIS